MISKIGKGGGKVGGPSRRVYPGMVFARKCGKRRADAECLRNRQTVFFIVRACRGSVGEGAACGGRAMSCSEPRHAGALHAASASGAVFTPGAERWRGSSPGAGHAQTKRGKLSSVGFRRAGGPGINRTRRPGEKVAAAQAFALARAHVVPRGLPGEAMPFASGSAGQRPALPMSAAPKCQSLVRSCATNAGKGATSVAFGADVCGVHARP